MPAPNFLLILTTQWRASACGYAGDPNARTPHLDRLAAASVNYTQAVTPHPFGPFARAALLTGTPSPQNGIREYFDPLPAGARTVAHTFNERGYATAYFGKWHLGRRDPQAALVGPAHAQTVIPPGERGGFSFWEGFEGGFLLNDPWLHGTRLAVPTQFPGYQSDVVCGRAAEWLGNFGFRNPNSGATRPWLCVVSVEAPHPPYDAPAAGVVARRPEELVLPANVPRGGEAEAKARKELAGYYAHIEATDRAIGRLVAGVPADTVVIVTSVHGDMHGAHGLFRKGWPHEESVRVPLLVRRPGVSPRRDNSAVSLLNLPAMLSNSAWTPPPAARISMPSVVALPHQCDRIWRGVRTHDRKLILNDDGSPWLLFDLASDPLETRNLANDPTRRDEITALRALME
ncbi:MAG TPA: sulfatase-like hydrolase/transferase [Opitutaceae bacterium]|nr:sulfatase-like hydrolase/transferase [Opitutaceae bacterium]HND60450.1 sulfatase-like hydrolase/transferase [Opitutaceae bacterium]